MKILVVDDHGMFLDGVESILKGEEDIEATHLVSNGDEAIEIMKQNHFDIVVTDISMPGINGKALCEMVTDISPETGVLAISMHDEYHHISELLEAGASGYILKNTRKEELISAIRAIYSGKTFYSQEVKDIIADNLSKSPNAKKTAQSTKLTKREIEVVKLIASEYSNKEIAEELCISLFTVESHRRYFSRKIGAQRVAGVIRYAL